MRPKNPYKTEREEQYQSLIEHGFTKEDARNDSNVFNREIRAFEAGVDALYEGLKKLFKEKGIYVEDNGNVMICTFGELSQRRSR